MRARLKLGPMLPALSLLMILSACSPRLESSATETTLCREMRADLPTYSRKDTAETLKSGARFVTTFNAICED